MILGKAKKFINEHITVIIITIIFIFIRLINIHSEEFWYDEYYNLLVAQKLNLFEIPKYTQHLYHPPAYYFFMHIWIKIFGLTEISSRIPSILFSIVCLYFFYQTLKLLFKNKITQQAGLLLLALSTLNIEYSQEARPYIMFLAIYSYVLWEIIHTIKTNKISNRSLLNITIASLIGIYTHYDYILYLTALITAVIINTFFQKSLASLHWVKKVLISYIITMLGFLPWAGAFLNGLNTGSYYGILLTKIRINIYYLFAYLNYFNFIENNKVLEILSFTIFAAILVLTIKYFKKLSSKNNEFVPIIFIFIISCIYFLISPLTYVYSHTWQRHILILNYLVILYETYLLSYIYHKKIIAIIVFLVLFSINLLTLPQALSNKSTWFYYYQNKKPLEYILNQERAGDLILIPRPTYTTNFYYYYKGTNRITSIINDDFDNKGLPSPLAISVAHSNDINFYEKYYISGLDTISKLYDRIWLVIFYNKEDSFTFDYFKNKPEWVINEVENLPNKRLWLLTKKS